MHTNGLDVWLFFSAIDYYYYSFLVFFFLLFYLLKKAVPFLCWIIFEVYDLILMSAHGRRQRRHVRTDERTTGAGPCDASKTVFSGGPQFMKIFECTENSSNAKRSRDVRCIREWPPWATEEQTPPTFCALIHQSIARVVFQNNNSIWASFIYKYKNTQRARRISV